MCTYTLFINVVSLSFLVMVEVQTANLLSEEKCRAIFGDYHKWEFNLMQASLRDTNTMFEVASILKKHQFSSITLKGLLCVDVCEVGISLNVCLHNYNLNCMQLYVCMYTHPKFIYFC